LEHEAYTPGSEMGEFPGRELEEVNSFKMEGSAVRSGKCSQEGHQRGFSRTGTTTDGDEFARLDIEGDLVDGGDGTSPGGIDPAEIAGGEDKTHSLLSRRSW
jgi:hypothetical protein